MILVLATNNQHKVREIKELLGGYFDEIKTLKEMNIFHETVEDGISFEENAVKKAREITELTGLCALADDSGICVEALGGAPGIYSARYASVDGHDASDKANRDLVLANVKNKENRRAYYACVVALTKPDGTVLTGEGRFYGEIIDDERGENGFGYDPIFYVPEYKMTVAEMEPDLKNSMSHRGKAIRELMQKL